MSENTQIEELSVELSELIVEELEERLELVAGAGGFVLHLRGGLTARPTL